MLRVVLLDFGLPNAGGNICCSYTRLFKPTGICFVSVTNNPHVKLPMGNLHGYIKNNHVNLHFHRVLFSCFVIFLMKKITKLTYQDFDDY